MSARPGLGVPRGAALYVGALLGPGLLLVPSLAVHTAGPASVLAWAAVLVLSAPLAATFATLGVRHPVPGGVAVYVREGLGEAAAAVTGVCFLAAVLLGAPAVAFVGGTYVADLAGGGRPVAVAVAGAIALLVLLANVVGLAASSALQLGLAAVLVVVIAVGVGLALPAGPQPGAGWTPFAPHGWWAVGTAANLLVWHVIGWEAMAQLAGDFADPRRAVPRAVALAFAVIVVLYAGLAVATVAVTTETSSTVPLADLLEVGLGDAGRAATVPLAGALTAATMNVYVAGAARLAGALAREGALPARLAAGGGDVPRRPLAVLAVVAAVSLAGLAAGVADVADLVRATSACFVAVYVLALTSAARILAGAARAAAAVSLALVLALAAFSGPFLLVPAAAAVVALAARGRAGRAASARGR